MPIHEEVISENDIAQSNGCMENGKTTNTDTCPGDCDNPEDESNKGKYQT